jgi:hypothetical protein
LGYVKFHPLVKTANLEINKAQASLMGKRCFDPKLRLTLIKNNSTPYYSILNSSLKFQLGMASKSKLVLIKTKDII